MGTKTFSWLRTSFKFIIGRDAHNVWISLKVMKFALWFKCSRKGFSQVEMKDSLQFWPLWWLWRLWWLLAENKMRFAHLIVQWVCVCVTEATGERFSLFCLKHFWISENLLWKYIGTKGFLYCGSSPYWNRNWQEWPPQLRSSIGITLSVQTSVSLKCTAEIRRASYWTFLQTGSCKPCVTLDLSMLQSRGWLSF